MSPLFHVANAIFLVSYAVRDILWLRVLTMVAQSCLLYASRAEPSLVAWNLLFLAINGVRVYMLILERRPVKLTEREARLYDLAFRSLTPRELRVLFASGGWRDAPAGDLVVERGKDLDRVMVIAEGRVEVMVDGKMLVELGPGAFVGEMSFLTGEAPRADVRTRESCSFFSWPKHSLAKVLEQSPELRAQMQMAIGRDLIAKLRST